MRPLGGKSSSWNSRSKLGAWRVEGARSSLRLSGGLWSLMFQTIRGSRGRVSGRHARMREVSNGALLLLVSDLLTVLFYVLITRTPCPCIGPRRDSVGCPGSTSWSRTTDPPPAMSTETCAFTAARYPTNAQIDSNTYQEPNKHHRGAHYVTHDTRSATLGTTDFNDFVSWDADPRLECHHREATEGAPPRDGLCCYLRRCVQT